MEESGLAGYARMVWLDARMVWLDEFYTCIMESWKVRSKKRKRRYGAKDAQPSLTREKRTPPLTHENYINQIHDKRH